MIRLWYSNQLEELVGALVDNERALRDAGATTPFDITNVIVPNRNLAKYLKFEMARRTGIMANVQFEYLVRFFRDAIVDRDAQVLVRDDLHTLLLDVLSDDELLADDELGAVRSYLDAAGSADDRDKRIWQLGHELARVFEEYTLSRPRMVDLWPSRPVLQTEPWASTERWERRVWNELFGRGGRVQKAAERRGRRMLALPELFEAGASTIDLPSHIHIFGLSYVARSFYRLFDQLADRCEVLIYTLNPCMEYWEDVPSGWNVGHARAWKRREAEQSVMFADLEEGDDDDPPALRAWGRPGRENIRMLNMLTECDFAGRFVDPSEATDTLLHRLQRDILLRQPMSARPDRRYADDSITVLACPSVQREIEVVADEILDLKRRYAERGESLEYNEIAVIVNNAERDAYQARIRAVFAEIGDIPHNIIDITASAHRRYLEAVELLTGLPFGRFTRRELLRLMTHDNVIGAFDGVDATDWERWCAELNILHGADAEDHDGTYIDGPLYHWEQGMRRLVLGGFMTGEPAGVSDTFVLGDERYVPFELRAQQLESAASFVSLARHLIGAARKFAAQRKPLGEWIEDLTTLIGDVVVAVDEDDETDRLRVARALDALRDRDLSTKPVGFRVLHEFVRTALAGMEISRGQYLSEGVVVSSFLPMRPIPFKAVFVTGLGERFFPRSDVRSPLDLRWSPEVQETNSRDVVTARAQDEYMFLETLISTRERFYASYVSRDGYTGESLEPSSVVRLLWFMLEQNYATPEALQERWITHPLRRWDDRYFGDAADLRTYQPDAHREATIARTRRSLEAYCSEHELPFPEVEALLEGRAAVAPEVAGELRDRVGLIAPPEAADEGADEIRVTLSQLRKFLESPTQGTAEFHLGMTDDEVEDPYGIEDERFETDVLLRAKLTRAAFIDELFASAGEPQWTDLRERFEVAYERAKLMGEVPSGPFGETDREKQLTVLRQWLDNYRLLNVGVPPRVIAFGRTRVANHPMQRHPPPELVVGDKTATLHGTTTLTWPDQRTSMVLTTAGRIYHAGRAELPFLRGFVELAALTAAKIVGSSNWRVALNATTPWDSARDVREFSPLDAEVAQSWICDIIAAMTAPQTTWFLPAEAVFDHRYANRKLPVHRWIDEARRSFHPLSYWRGPLHRPQDRFESPPDPEAVIAHRFGLYFARRVDHDG